MSSSKSRLVSVVYADQKAWGIRVKAAPPCTRRSLMPQLIDLGGELNGNLNNVSHSGGEEICVPLDRSSLHCYCRFAVECCLAADRELASAVGPVLRWVPQPEERDGRSCAERNRPRQCRRRPHRKRSRTSISASRRRCARCWFLPTSSSASSRTGRAARPAACIASAIWNWRRAKGKPR